MRLYLEQDRQLYRMKFASQAQTREEMHRKKTIVLPICVAPVNAGERNTKERAMLLYIGVRSPVVSSTWTRCEVPSSSIARVNISSISWKHRIKNSYCAINLQKMTYHLTVDNLAAKCYSRKPLISQFSQPLVHQELPTRRQIKKEVEMKIHIDRRKACV